MYTGSKHIFIVGIKGAAMANIAVLLKEAGFHVEGSDTDEEFITDEVLKKNGILVHSGFQERAIPSQTGLLLYSGAHQGTHNPQVQYAIKQGIPVFSQTAFLGEFMQEFETRIAVSGCHGKTTTSSLLSYALLQLNQNPTYVVGTPSFQDKPGSSYGGKKYFVIEADEYGINPPEDPMPKFHLLNPDWIICTNIDFDHPDIFQDLEHTKREFLKFFDHKKLILCRDDVPLRSLLPHLSNDFSVTYGFDIYSDMQIMDYSYHENQSVFHVKANSPKLIEIMGESSHEFITQLAGTKNVLNATAVITQLLLLGFDPDDIKTAIREFTGAKRRFELVYQGKTITLFDDYGHHPHEIEATIDAARSKFNGQRIIAIFQPHTFSRTHMLLSDFASALSKCDAALILPIFASAREQSTDFPVTSEDIQKVAQEKHIHTVNAYQNSHELLMALRPLLRQNDVLFTIGAGDVYRLKDDIIKVIKSYENDPHPARVDRGG